jgi:hypothetical protein
VNHLAYSPGRARALRLTARAASALLLGALGAAGCTAGVRMSVAGSGGSGATTGLGGSGASGGTTGTGGTHVTGSGGGGGDIVITQDAGPSDAAACQTTDVMFAPTNPTVYLLVDRSGSMFHCLTNTSNESTGNAICVNTQTNMTDPANTEWGNLKTAIEQVLPQLDSQVRFGFTTVYGTNPTSGGTCPSIQGMLTDDVPPALNNSGPIMTKYDSLGFPPNSTQAGIKFESPISESIGNVTTALMADTDPGSKYILLITDGQPDYCDDSNSLCAPDSVVWKLQTAAAAGIQTIVMGIQSTLFDLAPGVLQAFANAGAGEPTLAPVKSGGSTFDFYDQCDGIAGWAADLAAKGTAPARGDTLGTYSSTMGPTVPYTPSASDVTMLVANLSKALSGVRSCVFDLSQFTIDTAKLNEAQVYLVDSSGNKNVLKLDSSKTNGWYMDNITTNSQGTMTSTTLELFGSACDTLRSPSTVDIKFNFPCDLVITIDKP